jgi:hypothetical protein
MMQYLKVTITQHDAIQGQTPSGCRRVVVGGHAHAHYTPLQGERGGWWWEVTHMRITHPYRESEAGGGGDSPHLPDGNF